MIQKFAIGKVTAAKDAASVTVSANSNVQKNTLLSQLRDQLKCASLMRSAALRDHDPHLL